MSPLTVDIASATGHALIVEQGGIGSTPGYDAIDVRRLARAGPQEGVIDAGAWVVSQTTPVSLGINVAANVGVAVIQGDSILAQGMYVVSPHTAVVNLTFNAADPSNPRIDQIILHVYDNANDGSGLNKASLEVLSGTPFAGATLDNRNGAAALPATALRLADVRIGAGATTIANTSIRDRRRWTYGACWQGTRSTDIVRSANNWTEVDPNNLIARLECTGAPLLFNFSANGDGGGGGAGNSDLLVSAWEDGPAAGLASPPGQLIDVQKFGTVASGSANRPCNFTMVHVPTAGSHLYSAVMQATGNDNVTVRGISHFNIRELVGANANNGVS
jgi:hypothetical protein